MVQYNQKAAIYEAFADEVFSQFLGTFETITEAMSAIRTYRQLKAA